MKFGVKLFKLTLYTERFISNAITSLDSSPIRLRSRMQGGFLAIRYTLKTVGKKITYVELLIRKINNLLFTILLFHARRAVYFNPLLERCKYTHELYPYPDVHKHFKNIKQSLWLLEIVYYAYTTTST